ncbi:MAG: FG-GAP repeat protein [Enhygromyxa sp.]
MRTVRPQTTILCLSVASSATACSGAPANVLHEREVTGSLGSPTLARNLAQGDFDGDGVDDWAFGVGGDETDCSAGQVRLWYQVFDGDRPHEIWHRGMLEFSGNLCDANFGASVAIGDFNGDDYDDLAVGVPGDFVDGQPNAGSIHVVYGSHRGLDVAANQTFSQSSPGLAGSAKAGHAFGTALASGDFNCDGYADLAIGVPGEGANAGALHVIFGTSEGLRGSGSQFLKYSPRASGSTAHYYGSFLAAGNINADHYGAWECDDLAVGIPGEPESNASIPTTTATGRVAVIYGSGAGFEDIETEISDHGDGFGRGVWIIDGNLDGYGDLLTYADGDDQFYWIYGTSTGLASPTTYSHGKKQVVQGKLRDACVWACQLAWLLAPPGPVCDCSGCEILTKTPSSPCPNCG